VNDVSAAVSSALTADVSTGTNAAHEPIGSPPPSSDLLARLRSISGVHGVTVIHTNPLRTPDPAWGNPAKYGVPQLAGLAACSQLATMPAFSTCPPGAQTASVAPGFGSIGWADPGDWPSVWPAAALSEAALERLPAQEIVVDTDGSTGAIERARTLVETAYPGHFSPSTIGEDQADILNTMSQYQQLADVVTVVSLVIAGFSLAVAMAGGLSERQRPFSLLRLSGVPLGVLRRVVLIESAVPLLTVAAVAIGTGLLAAHLFLEAQYRFSLKAPGVEFYVIVVAGLTLSLAVIASTLPLLRRITGPETARND
jgi:hypothetical protein